MSTTDQKHVLRAIPSVDEVLRLPFARSITEAMGHAAAVGMVQRAIEAARSQMDAVIGRGGAIDLVLQNLSALQQERSRKRLKRVINATGVIIHTNLGRSHLSESAVTALVTTASGYCNVELDLNTGERGRRGHSPEMLLAELTTAQDALIVNNCAAAALLTLSSLAEGGEVIVSRGELVEIGGDFRIPDVLERSGCKLREVGTTNRTKLSDYERAISVRTKAILRVHPSNYRITGFTEKPLLSDLSRLAHANDLVLIEDAGSGALFDLSEFGLADEPVIQDAVAAGADIVTFSGDKLMGGVQAGMIVGRRHLINRIRRNPLYRALRADKLVYAAIEATLQPYARGNALQEIPTLRMLSADTGEIEARAELLISRFDEHRKENVTLSLEPGFSAVGGGTGPGVELPTQLIAISHRDLSVIDVAAYFRGCSTPIITRINDGRVVVDLRTVDEKDDEYLVQVLLDLSVSRSPQQSSA